MSTQIPWDWYIQRMVLKMQWQLEQSPKSFYEWLLDRVSTALKTENEQN